MSENKPEKYFIGGEHEDVYFTRQEARCMVCMLKGATVKRTADTLELSPRTTEFYVNKMKAKLDVNTKTDLIRAVIDSDFLDNDNVSMDPMAF